MTPQTATERMNAIQASQRPYVSTLLQKMAFTYALPLGAALLLATVGALLLAQFIPSSTATAIVFALNVGVFYYGWNAMEKRTKATALFALYVAGSRERRTLRAMIGRASNDTSAREELAQQVRRYDESARAFVQQIASS